LRDLCGVELLSCNIPNTAYNVTSANNTFIFNEGGPNLTAVFTPGAYDILSFLDEIKRAMDLVGALTYTVTYNEITFKIRIAGTAPWTSIGGTACYTMGWDESILPAGPFAAQLAVFAVRLDVPRSWLIQIQQFNSSCSKSTSSSTPGTFIVNSKINSGYHDISTKNTDYNYQELYNSQTLSQLNIVLLNEEGNQVDLIGSDWSMLLRLSYNEKKGGLNDSTLSIY
jgi:hypothetical protein